MSEEKAEVIAFEVANAEFERFVDSMDLDLDVSDMDAEDLTAFNKGKRRVLRAISRGHLVINDDGEAIFTPSNSRTKNKEPITFHERSGASLMAMDGKKKGYDVSKTYAIMADMCRNHQSVFAGMVGNDIKVCEALFHFLMD